MDYEKLRDTRNTTNPYAKRMGIFVEEIGPGCARAVMDVTPDDANPVGVPHGGCYFSLADTASGSAMASHGYYAVTISAALPTEKLTVSCFWLYPSLVAVTVRMKLPTAPAYRE